MKLFRTNNIDVDKCCRYYFGFDLPSAIWLKRVQKSEAKFKECDNYTDNLARSANLPEGLCILPSVISIFFFFFFFFIFNDFSETNYLRIRWTDFRNLFTE